MKYLVIAEKPSVSKSIAKVIGAYRQEDGYLEGGDCVVSWCLGHLAEYAAPEHYDERYENWRFEDLPILPAEWKLLVHSTKKPQFNVLRKLLRSKKFDYVVNACDAGREGEAIFRRVYALAGSNLPIKRLWISSMEDAAIQQGFENLKDGAAYDNLFAASECRAKADWLIGMNGTRAFTKKYGRKQAIGRVQTPTLAMLAERQAKIKNFVKEPYYKVELSGAGVVAVSEQMAQEQDADAVQAACDGQCAVVGSIERKPHDFMRGIHGLLDKMLADLRQIPTVAAAPYYNKVGVGNCPVCGNPVHESKLSFCCADRSCKFALWKESRYLSNMRKTLDKKMAADLLKKGRTHVKDFYSVKKDKMFAADLVMRVEDGRAQYSLEFPKAPMKTKP